MPRIGGNEAAFWGFSALAAELARNHHLLDLVGPLAAGEDLGVAVNPAHRVLLDIAVPAVDLNCLLGGPIGQATGLELRLGGRECERAPEVLLDRRPVGQKP